MHADLPFFRRGLLFAGFCIAIFPLFYQLGNAPLRLWDESLFAMRAYYMTETGHYLPNFDYFPGITFYRNLKPPFGTWFQALSFRWFGYTEWALRFPIAVCSASLMALLMLWGNTIARNAYTGIIAGLILIASPGFLRDHVARTGDHDAILLLLMTAGLLLCFFASQAETLRSRRLYLALLGLTLFLGFLTKSFFALALCPAFVLYFMLRGQLGLLLRDPFTWFLAGLAAAGIGLYYLSMESAFPGFWQYESDTVLGRYLKIQDGHELAWNYYLTEFFNRRFFPWFLVLPLHLYLIFKSRSASFRAFALLLWLGFLVHFLMITFSTTKLSWYDAPLYPIAALMAGSAIGEWITEASHPIRRAIIVIMTVLILVPTYYRGLQHITQTGPASDEERYQSFMRDLQEKRPDLTKYTVYCYEYNGQVGYTARLLNDKYGYEISVAVYYPEMGFGANDYIMVCNTEKEEKVRSKHQVVAALEQAPCRLLRLVEN